MNVKNGIKWMELFNEYVQGEKDILTELDTKIGDGDHGNNMSRGMKHVISAIEKEDIESFEDLFKIISIQLISKVGGASGPLYGSAFLGMTTAIKNEDSEWSEVFDSGVKMIQKRGKSEAGEKTMLDVWIPAVKLLETNELTIEKIDELVQNTKDLKATKGRASYLGERSIGHIDPGAYSSGLLFKALLEAEVIK